MLFQDLGFFARLSPGELMARTSGDSLTLRSIVSSTTYKVGVGVGAGGGKHPASGQQAAGSEPCPPWNADGNT